MKRFISTFLFFALMSAMTVSVASNTVDKHGGEVSKTFIEKKEFTPVFVVPNEVIFESPKFEYEVIGKIGKVINKPLTRDNSNIGYYWTSGKVSLI